MKKKQKNDPKHHISKTTKAPHVLEKVDVALHNPNDSSIAIFIPDGYKEFLLQIKNQIKTAKMKAMLSVNNELLKLYWHIGSRLFQKENEEGWGAKVVEKLAKDLKTSFPDTAGFSKRNLFYMKKFAEAYPDFEIVQQLVAQIPWGHNIILLTKIKNSSERLWYVQKTTENGWSRSVLETWIENDLYNRQGRAVTNFKVTLPKSQSDLAQQTTKDPYIFDFLTLREDFLEKEIEDGLVNHMQKALIELGQGFAFMGRQYKITIDDEDHFIDLLFYHTKLRAYVVVEIKARTFEAKDAGQLSMYLSAVDDMLRHPDDQPTYGMILCKGSNKKLKIEYALRNFNRPISVSGYITNLVEKLPEELKGTLPTIEELEEELSGN